MTDVADGNSVTMSAAQDISLLDRPEGFVSSRLSPCSDTSLGGFNKSLDPEVEVGSSGKVPPVSDTLLGEAVVDHDEGTLSTGMRNVSVGAEDSRASLGCPRRDFQGMKDKSIEESISKTENLKDWPAVEIPAVKISVVEISTVETPAVEILGKLPVDTPAVISTPVKTHAIEASTGEAYDMDAPVSANLEMEATRVDVSDNLQDLIEDGVKNVGADVRNIDAEAEDVILLDMSTDNDFGGEQESLPRPFENERRDLVSEFSTVNESPSTENEDPGQQVRDSGFNRNGETRMDGTVFATNRSFLSMTGATRVGNEVINSITAYTIGTTVERTFEKFAEDTGDKLVDKAADRMADAIADEIADQIADRMADEIADKVADEMADEMADVVADDMADRMADEMASRMADEMADRMADEMADRMADEMTAKMADELADEVIEGDYGRAEGVLENQRMDGGTLDVGDMEEEMAEDANKVMVGDDYEDDEGTADEQMSFVEELERFFKQRNLEYKAPKFYGLELNVLKLWRVVSRFGGYDHVTVSKLWRTVGEEFKPPKTCTTISWSFRGFYEKALLDYERFKTGVSAPDCSQRAVQTTSCGLANQQRTASPATPSSELNMGGTPGSGSGRARRDAAARAMQGWHSQRMGNGDSKELITKDKGSGGKHVKKEKKLTNIDRSCGELPTEDTLHLDAGGYGMKRKGSSTVLERAVKAVQARGRPRLYTESLPSNSAVTGKRSMKQQDSGRRPMKIAKVDEPMGDFDPPIVDEGPKADWVKINVHKHLDCFEIYALVPGLAREEVRIQCEPGGRLVIAGMPEDPENPWGVTPFRKCGLLSVQLRSATRVQKQPVEKSFLLGSDAVISLPSRIDAHQTSAVVTLYGQLYVRVPIAEDDKSS